MEWVTKDPKGYEQAKEKENGGRFGDIFTAKSNPFAEGQ